MNQNWQHNQRRMIRDRVAFVRFNRNEQPIRLNRIDVVISHVLGGMDGWGRMHVENESRSVWEDPIGRQFSNLNDAIQQIHIDRCNHRFA